MSESQTHFGYRTVSAEEKDRLVDQVFRSVASRYDLMNDLMSFGVHRLWKRFTIGRLRPRSGEHMLDLAGGTGDMSKLLIEQLGADGGLVLADINAQMLRAGRDRLLDLGIVQGISYVQANAEALPFPANTFDGVVIAFGLRNMTHKEKGLREMQRITRPGGRVAVLEFSKLVVPLLQKIYDTYSFRLIPALGARVAADEASYRYLVESIRRHPDQEALKRMMLDSGFEQVDYYNLSAGIVALHMGLKL